MARQTEQRSPKSQSLNQILDLANLAISVDERMLTSCAKDAVDELSKMLQDRPPNQPIPDYLREQERENPGTIAKSVVLLLKIIDSNDLGKITELSAQAIQEKIGMIDKNNTHPNYCYYKGGSGEPQLVILLSPDTNPNDIIDKIRECPTLR
jgi:hypothetical protein